MPLLPLSHLQVSSLNELPAVQALGVVANFIKILEAAVIGFGALQLWTNRQERREAERRAAAIAQKAANYEAWQVINGAYGKGGSGGRVDALQDLVINNVTLAGVWLDGAWLEGVSLPAAMLRHASLRKAVLRGANFCEANLEGADFAGAELTGALLRGAHLRGANLAGASLGTADLSDADLRDIRGWAEITSISYTNLSGVRNAPPGFLEWAREHGAADHTHAPTEPDSQQFSTIWRAV